MILERMNVAVDKIGLDRYLLRINVDEVLMDFKMNEKELREFLGDEIVELAEEVNKEWI